MEKYSHPGAYIVEGAQDWQIFQRGDDDTAEIRLAGVWMAEQPCAVEVRAVREDNGRAASAVCDWHDAEMTGENQWAATLKVPVGGLYRFESRLRQLSDDWRLTGDRILHVAVGDLWVLAGQSNTTGYGHGPVDDPVSLGVHMFGADLLWKLATHPIHDTTRTTHPANRDVGFVDHSPWLTFARRIYEEIGVPIGLLPTALGGSPLQSWDPYAESPILYKNMMDVISKAGGKVAGMAWYQGESDSGPELAPTYAERFTRFIKKWREELGGADLPVLTAQLNRMDGVYDGLKEPWWGMVREAQRQVARTVPNVAVLPTLDLPISDGIHTSSVGNVVLGGRFADAALAMVYCRNVEFKAPEISSAAVSEDKKSVRLEFEHVRGWLMAHENPAPDFVIEEGGATVAVVESEAKGNAVVLKLERALEGEAFAHGALSPNPRISIKDEEQRPVLGFYRFPIR